MSEITKLYENAGIKPDINYVCDKEPCEQHSVDCQQCLHIYDTREDYPDFTAEKLIKLEMFLINKGDFDIKKGSVDITFESFTSCIAGLINNLWQDLTEEEKEQIKEILQ